MGELRDYVRWHDDYERPGSHLHHRLQVVIRMIQRALDELPAGEIRVLSLCAGQGADILGAADGHAPRALRSPGRLNRMRCGVPTTKANFCSAIAGTAIR